MEILLVVLGVLIDVFLLLAITNGLKRYTKFSLVHIIASYFWEWLSVLSGSFI